MNMVYRPRAGSAARFYRPSCLHAFQDSTDSDIPPKLTGRMVSLCLTQEREGLGLGEIYVGTTSFELAFYP
jgi:hypothetical protein